MTPHCFDRPDDPRELAAWLERHLVGLSLGELIAEWSAAHAEDEPRTQTLADLLGDDLPAVLDRGLSVLAESKLRSLIRWPWVLRELQHRVLVDGGTLILTTPNVASYTAVARVLEMSGNPQLYSMYPDPRGEFADSEVGHMREYTPAELEEAVRSAGFDIEHLFTHIAPGYHSHLWAKHFLERNNATTILRGEQMFCRARKNPQANIRRYPSFLYEGM